MQSKTSARQVIWFQSTEAAHHLASTMDTTATLNKPCNSTLEEFWKNSTLHAEIPVFLHFLTFYSNCPRNTRDYSTSQIKIWGKKFCFTNTDNLIGRAAKVTFQAMRCNQDAPPSQLVNELKPEKVLDSCLSTSHTQRYFWNCLQRDTQSISEIILLRGQFKSSQLAENCNLRVVWCASSSPWLMRQGNMRAVLKQQ